MSITSPFWQGALVMALLLCNLACTQKPAKDTQAEVERQTVKTESFGHTIDGPAYLYTLENQQGLKVKITNYGGIITAIHTPDRAGEFADVTLGFDSLAPYQAKHPYFGAIIGRYGNRIADGTFVLEGQRYHLPANNAPNSLHGGDRGFDKRLWTSTAFAGEARSGVILKYTSPAGEQGYPGTVSVKVTYSLNNENELMIVYAATSDAPTPINLTNHTYFNLAGKGTILNHELLLHAEVFTPVNEVLIPTGELQPVKDTPFDFTTAKPIGQAIEQADQQLLFGKGYDHNFVVNREGNGLELIASVYEPTTGRTLEVLTQAPAVQFYTGNFLNGSLTGKGGVVYDFRTGFCLETQHYPDSPNQPDFPNTILRPGETYKTVTVYRFGVR